MTATTSAPHSIDLRTLVADAFGNDLPVGADDTWADITVTGIEHDSRAVLPGSLFCAVPGEVNDGHAFVKAAAESGAVAAVVERRVDCPVIQVPVSSVRSAMPLLAARLFEHPSRDVSVVGVTGTNGKTTMTHMIASIIEASGNSAATIGTLSGARTTPESPELQRQLRLAARAGHAAVALEVSSHALQQHRVDGTRFAVAVFTNLTPDHLDFHGSMEAYFGSKALLFDDRSAAAIIVVGDAWGERLAALRPDAILIDPVTVRNSIRERTTTHTTFLWDGHAVALPLVGDFNVVNAVCAAHAASVLGIDHVSIRTGLESLSRIAGRMDLVPGLPAEAPQVYVDYSHTPDSLERALRALRQLGTGRVLVVFGCGGDRDRQKRPLMGAAAVMHADLAIVTSDNPRGEAPEAIINAILEGITDVPLAASGRGDFLVEVDRADAIALALGHAGPDDVVLIAGKGHETTQTIGTASFPFDDRHEVQKYWGAAR